MRILPRFRERWHNSKRRCLSLNIIIRNHVRKLLQFLYPCLLTNAIRSFTPGLISPATQLSGTGHIVVVCMPFFKKGPITYFKQSPTLRSCRSQVANLDLEFPLTKALKPSKEPRSQVSPGSYRPLGLYSNMVAYLRALANQEIIFPLSYRLPPLTLLTRGDAYRTTLIRRVLTLPLYFPTFQIKKCTIQKYKKGR